MRQLVIEEERNVLWKSVNKHPTVLVHGPSYTGVRRMLESLVQYHLKPEATGEADLVYNYNHPDVSVVDCRLLKTSEAREAKEGLSSHPARWSHRYLFLTHAERLHNTAAQTFLKLIEEPPTLLRTIITTDVPFALPETILSRSILVPIITPAEEEIESLLETLNVNEPTWRSRVCYGDVDLALDMDVDITKDWYKLFSTILAGSAPPPEFVYKWQKRIEGANESTQIVLWNIAISIAVRKPFNKFWQEVALKAMSEREKIKRKKSNNITVGTTLAGIYAYTKTATTRAGKI